MVSHKISKSCGIISRTRNTLDIKSKKVIYYSLIHPYLTYSDNVWSSTYRNNLKTICTAQRRSVRTLFATAQQPQSRDIFINQKILPLDKLINQQEGILAYKVINGTYLLNDNLNHGDVRHQIQFLPLWVRGDQNSANVCPCKCRKRRLIIGYKLSYITDLLYAWSSCMQ